MHIVLVSSGQPSANPRLVKEAVAYSEAGYAVTVVYCPLSPWADIYDRALFKKYASIKWVRAGYHSTEQKALYVFARLRQKIYQYLFLAGIHNAFTAVRSMSLFTQELISAAKRIKGDVYAGHNLSALPAVVQAAHMHRVPAIFDFEDFHRGEDQEGSLHWIKTKIVEDQYSSLLHHATTASPLINAAYAQLYPSVKFTTINNCFSIRYLQSELRLHDTTRLKLFWFSQFVGKKRGLETIIEAIGKTGEKNISLTLLGNCAEDIKAYFVSFANEKGLTEDQLLFMPAVAEESIPSIAAAHDLGLACEIPHVVNRDICLTNKIFLYLLAGNVILFSNTKAQTFFYKSYPETGAIYPHDNAEELAVILQRYAQDRQLLNRQRATALSLGKTFFNWEAEQQQLLKLVSDL
jgi:glycosyltransferase involved in cell wall biosynthesis